MRQKLIKKIVILPLFIFFCQRIGAQVSHTNRLLEVHKTFIRLNIDGSLSDEAWINAAIADSFINKWPTDSGKAMLQTTVKVTYDEKFIYFGIRAEMAGKDPVIQSLKRDVNPYYSDGVSVVIDPSGKSTSGYTFGVNAADAQMEGIVEVNNDSFDWDTKWYSATKMYKGYWTAELAIPFKSFRFPRTAQHWGINFIRNDMTNNCFSTWNQVPIQFFGANLNCLGRMSFADAPPAVKTNNAFIPYISANVDQQQSELTSAIHAGIDAKIAVNSALNLDATINPDFSQVDVDRQIINLDRFNVLLPERRTFFLENSDLFARFGSTSTATPFVSRRVGLTDDGRVIPLLGGLRITGNLNPSLRIGIMNIESAKKYEQRPQNYTVAAFDQKLFRRSNLRGIVTNRQQTSTENSGKGALEFNRVAGSEFSFLSDNSKFNGRAGYYHSFNPGQLMHAKYSLASFGYTDKRMNIAAGWSQVDSNFIADLGFTPRLYNYDATNDTTIRIGYNAYNSSLDYFIYPSSKRTINSIDLSIRTDHYYSTSGRFIEFNGAAGADMLFSNRREASISWTQNSVNLPYETVIFAETGPLPKTKYDFGYIQAKFLSNFLKPFSWGLTLEHGGYYNGKRTTYTGTLKYRKQPWGNFGIDFSYNNIILNDKEINPFIIGPTIELAFSNNLFWTTFLQYNTAIKNFNINSRFQWRFKPMSDVFLVYTDNYFTEGLLHKTRSIVFKATYWIN
ncbi:MAG TPA: DUF5916 domain-containing protein [Chitinophagaceae bacterium]|nr:DUF5916 domain-containing protein [Chitinophagaceae bacterium]